MRWLILVTLGLLVLTPAHAASLDCTKAATSVEKMIREDNALSKLDESLNAKYQQALEREDRRRDIIKSERSWIRNVLNKCVTRECIEGAYESRIKELELTASFGTVFFRLPPSDKSTASAASAPAALSGLSGAAAPSRPASLPPVLPASQETAVGFCAGPPCCTYEHKSCSASDTRSLIASARIVTGDRKFCTKLMNSQWHYLPMNLDHTVKEEETEDFLSLRAASTDIWPEAGYFDINNDGKPEYLAWLTAYSGAGQGCDVEIYAELNSDRTHLLHSPLTELLGSNGCGTYQRAFRFEDKTYIENRRTIKRDSTDVMYPGVLTEVYMIKGNKMESICRFSVPELEVKDDDDDEN
jgi:uncharacterized protein